MESAELADPRSIPMDGGVFSRSIIAPNYSARFPSQSSDFSQSRAAQQLQLLKTHLTHNRLKNFSSSFLSENNPHPYHWMDQEDGFQSIDILPFPRILHGSGTWNTQDQCKTSCPPPSRHSEIPTPEVQGLRLTGGRETP
jgi:hypothetical protein